MSYPFSGLSPLVPSGTVVKGANLTVKVTQITWGDFWVTLYDWEGWIKPQIDAAISVGANCIRTIGGIGGILGGAFTREQYLTNQTQYMDYLVSENVLSYAVGTVTTDWGSYSLEDQISELVAYCQFIEGYENVIGIDLVQEAPSGGPNTTDAATILAACRAVTSKPLTFSLISGSGAVGIITAWEPVVDYIDYHNYAQFGLPFSVEDINTLRTAGIQKAILIGETGVDYAHPDSYMQFEYWGNTRMAYRPDVVGALFWAVISPEAGTTGNFGMFDVSFTAIPKRVSAFQAWPSSRSAKYAKDQTENGYDGYGYYSSTGPSGTTLNGISNNSQTQGFNFGLPLSGFGAGACVEITFKFASLPITGPSSIISQWTAVSGLQASWLIYTDVDNIIHLGWLDLLNAFHSIDSSAISDTDFHSVAADYDGTTMRLFLDGELQGTVVTTSPIAPTETYLTVGYFDYSSDPFAGTIGETQVSNISRHASNYTHRNITPDANTVMFWNGTLLPSSSTVTTVTKKLKLGFGFGI